VVRGDSLTGPVLLLGFVAFPAELDTIGEAELSALVTLKPDGVPVLLPVVGAFVVPRGTLIMLPRGNVLVLVSPGGRTFVGGDGKDGPLVILNDVGLEHVVLLVSKLFVVVQ
jgi:hypothetical protein